MTELDFGISFISLFILVRVSCNQINTLYLVHSELDLNRLDGDSVCPPMRSGQDDLPGEAKKKAADKVLDKTQKRCA